MKKIIILMLTSLGLSSVCCAGQYGDELGRCLVKNASEADTKVLTQWAFVTLGQTKGSPGNRYDQSASDQSDNLKSANGCIEALRQRLCERSP